MNTAQLESTRMKETAVVTNPIVVPPARASKWWVWLILIAVALAFGYFIYHRLESAKSTSADSAKSRAAHDLPVTVARVRRGDLNQFLVGLGTVTPLNTVTVKSRVDGAITDILFNEGQKVKKDQPLINIDPRPYEAALQQAKGQLAKDTAAEQSADWNVQQDTIALKDKAIAQQQLHTDTATRDQARGAIDVDNAAVANAQLNITYSHITSPIDGTVGLRLVDVGNIVHASDTTGLLVITQLTPIAVVFTVTEDDITSVQARVASGPALMVDAYDRDLVRKLATGKVLAIDNQIDPNTGTVKIKAQFDNADNALYPSQFVNARMLVNTIKDAVLVPTAAIQHSPTSTFAYVVLPDASPAKDETTATGPPGLPTPATKPAKESRIVTMREVVIGASQAAVGTDSQDTTVVLSGLEPGDIVVTDGVDKLIEGTRVIPNFAPTTKARGTTQESATIPASSQPTRKGRGRKPMD